MYKNIMKYIILVVNASNSSSDINFYSVLIVLIISYSMLLFPKLS